MLFAIFLPIRFLASPTVEVSVDQFLTHVFTVKIGFKNAPTVVLHITFRQVLIGAC